MRLVFLFVFLSAFSLFAQLNDEKLAAQYFSDKEYQKAADLYEDLAKKQPESVYFYENLLQCYIQMNDFKSAEKMIDKRIKKFNDQFFYKVDKAFLFQIQNKTSDRDNVIDQLLNYNFKYIDEVNQLANGFIKRRFYDQAIAVYIKAKQNFKDQETFAYELSELYFQTQKINEGTNELLDLLIENDLYLEEVKNRLVLAYQLDINNYKILSMNLLGKLQKQPNSYALNDLLVWSFTQQKDWEGAVLQTKAVDKRLKEDGRKMIELSYVLLQNDAFEEAVKCYDYVKSLGSDKRYYFQAQQGILNCGMLNIRRSNGASIEIMKSLENEYLNLINTNGVNWQSANQMKELAELYIYYMHETDKGIDLLNKILKVPGIGSQLQATSKLDLGDAMLIKGESWEADLLYKQVEKSYTNDPLGQEARFRYARLCYFRGDFEWAQTQLDVLKGATTQLISNNAMRLWLIIQDNTGLDSNEDALKLYAEADLLIFQNKFDEALLKLGEINEQFPGHTLNDEILFSKAVIAEKRGIYKEAENYYLAIVKDYSYDILADNALFNLAQLYEYKLNDKEKAQKMYEIIVLDFTGSLYVSEARKHFRNLRGDSETKIEP
jgi:tetratricopeptide (TPR) repeat protein